MPIRVGIVSETPIYRHGLMSILSDTPDIQVIGACDLVGAPGLLDCVLDVLLLDVASVDDAALLGTLLRTRAGPKLVVVGVRESVEEILRWFEAGASGYVDRQANGATLLETVREVVRGQFRPSPEVSMALVSRLQAPDPGGGPGSRASSLTRRELEIVDLLSRGLSNKEIAERLHVDVSTVKNHVHNLMEKLHLHRRIQVTTLFMPTGGDHSRPPEDLDPRT